MSEHLASVAVMGAGRKVHFSLVPSRGLISKLHDWKAASGSQGLEQNVREEQGPC